MHATDLVWLFECPLIAVYSVCPGNMYWVDTGLEVIEVAKLDGTQRFVVVSDNLYNPNSLVLHPQKG